MTDEYGWAVGLGNHFTVILALQEGIEYPQNIQSISLDIPNAKKMVQFLLLAIDHQEEVKGAA